MVYHIRKKKKEYLEMILFKTSKIKISFYFLKIINNTLHYFLILSYAKKSNNLNVFSYIFKKKTEI